MENLKLSQIFYDKKLNKNKKLKCVSKSVPLKYVHTLDQVYHLNVRILKTNVSI